MMRRVCAWSVLLVSMAVAQRVCRSETVEIDPGGCVIVRPADAKATQLTPVEELRKHLKLVTGTDIALVEDRKDLEDRYPFYVSIAPADGERALAPEEARWVVTPEATYLYGNDDGGRGSQCAVYGFLEDQLGVRWIAPGDRGIAYERRTPTVLTTGESRWAPELKQRKIRPDARPKRYPRIKAYVEEFAEFMRSHEEHDQYAKDVREWQLRMRMGGHEGLGYGHAFTGWWDRYSKTHPDYFALNKWGKREPELRVEPKTENPAFTAKDRESIKVCPSNPKVAEQIVQNWVARGKRTKWVNACMNDQVWGFCRCPDCAKLDVPKEGERFGDHLADRYVYLANQVARLARQHDPEAGATM